MLALIPTLMAVVHLGRLQDLQSETVNGSRYLTWERTVWNNGGSGASKSNTQLRSEMRDRIHGNDAAGLVSPKETADEGVAVNPIWRSVDGDSKLDGSAPEGMDAINTSSSNESLSMVSGPLKTVAEGTGVPSAASAFGLDGDMLDVPVAGIDVRTAEATAKARLQEKGELKLSGRGPGDNGQPIRFNYDSGILTDDWRSASESSYIDRTENIVAEEAVDKISKPAQVLGNFPVFKEAEYAEGTDFVPKSDVILEEYKPDND